MKTGKKVFVVWIIIMFLATFTCSLVYVVSQQTLRLGANDLPTTLAAETAIKLQNGQNASDAVPAEKVDASKSLNTFVMIYDKDKNLIASSGTMGASQPVYPPGVLGNVDQKGEARVTWQPKAGLRYASVAIKYDNGYIVAARSLHETEKLIGIAQNLILLAWLACAVFSALVLVLFYLFFIKAKKAR